MAKLLRAAIKLTVVGVVLGSIAAAVTNALIVYEVCEADYANSYGSSHELSPRDMSAKCRWFAFGKSADSIAYIVTAIATAGLVFYTLKLGAIAKTQTKQLKRTNDYVAATERARVFATVHMEMMTGLAVAGGNPDRLQVWVIFKNHGKTPATLTDVRGYTMRHDGYPDSLVENPFKVLIPEGVPIGAGETFRYDFLSDHDAEVAQILDPVIEKYLCLGIIEYRDIFGEEWETAYCWEYRTRFGSPYAHIAPANNLNFHRKK